MVASIELSATNTVGTEISADFVEETALGVVNISDMLVSLSDLGMSQAGSSSR